MAGIARYTAVDFGTVKKATEAAGALIEYLGTPAGARHGTGLRRAVIWGEGAEAGELHLGRLYLSDGALDAARERRLSIPDGEAIAADQIPRTARLLHGNPQ